MFDRCRLQISQIENPDNWAQQRWLQVTLQTARQVNLDASVGDDVEGVVDQCVRSYDEVGNYRSGIGTWFGHWALGINSRNGQVDTTYTIGDAPQAQKFWIFYSSHKRLDFVQYARQTDGSLNYRISMSLDLAWIAARGIYPIGQSGPGYSQTQIAPRDEVQGFGRVFGDVGHILFTTRYGVWWHLDSTGVRP